MLKLIKMGKNRQEAYKIVQSAARERYDSGHSFETCLCKSLSEENFGLDQIGELISETTLEKHLGNIDKIFERALK